MNMLEMIGDFKTIRQLHEETYLVGPDKLCKRSLDSAVSSLLALISREYAQLAHHWFIYARPTITLVVQWYHVYLFGGAQKV